MPTLPLETAQPATFASPVEQLRQRLTIARIAVASLPLPKTERDRRSMRLLLKALDDATAVLPQL